jgi:hypothetical protein
MNWFVGFMLLGISWGSVIMLDVAFRSLVCALILFTVLVGLSLHMAFTSS